MLVSAISKSKLHCCLTILIVFILIFLSLPLLLIYLANTRYEEWQNQRSQQASGASAPTAPADAATTATSGATNNYQLELSGEILYPFSSLLELNCTDHALRHNLTLTSDADGKYSDGYWRGCRATAAAVAAAVRLMGFARRRPMGQSS